MSAEIELNGGNKIGRTARVTTLTLPDADAENTLDKPNEVVPRTGDFGGVAGHFNYPLEANSLTTLRIPLD